MCETYSNIDLFIFLLGNLVITKSCVKKSKLVQVKISLDYENYCVRVILQNVKQ